MRRGHHTTERPHTASARPVPVCAAGCPWICARASPTAATNFEFRIPTRDKSGVTTARWFASTRCYSRCIIWQVPDKSTSARARPPWSPIRNRLARAPGCRLDARVTRSARSRDHGEVPWVPHPPLQARHGGLPRARRPGLPDRRAREGHLGVHLVSDGGTRPFAHYDPTFASLQRWP